MGLPRSSGPRALLARGGRARRLKSSRRADRAAAYFRYCAYTGIQSALLRPNERPSGYRAGALTAALRAQMRYNRTPEPPPASASGGTEVREMARNPTECKRVEAALGSARSQNIPRQRRRIQREPTKAKGRLRGLKISQALKYLNPKYHGRGDGDEVNVAKW